MKTITNIINPTFALLALACFALLPMARAVNPPPDGCYPGFTTAEGCNALHFNTAVGAGALILNNGDSNTAVGAVALLSNSTGTENTAVGTDALVYNDSGGDDTAVGFQALFSNTTGGGNTAIGSYALYSNTTGGQAGLGTGSVAIGYDAL